MYDDLEDRVEENFLALVGGCFALVLGVITFGLLKRRAQDRKIRYSDYLEVDRNYVYARPEREVGCLYVGIVSTILALLLVAALFNVVFGSEPEPVPPRVQRSPVVTSTPTQESSEDSPWETPFFFAVVFGLLALYSLHRFWHGGVKSQPKSSFVPAPLALSQAKVYQVRLPETTVFEPQKAVAFLSQLLNAVDHHLTFQIVAEQGRVGWRIVDLRVGVDPTTIKNKVQAFYPSAVVSVEDVVLDEFFTPSYRGAWAFTQDRESAAFFLPIARVQNLAKSDPLIGFTHELSTLQSEERAVYTLFVADNAKFLYDQIERLTTMPAYEAELPGCSGPAIFIALSKWGISKLTGQTERVPVFDSSTMSTIDTKLKNIVYQCLLLYHTEAPSRERAEIVAATVKHFREYDADNFLREQALSNGIQFIDDPAKAEVTGLYPLLGHWLEQKHTTWRDETVASVLRRWLGDEATNNWRDYVLLLDTDELAALWHLPYAGFTSPAIEWLPHTTVPVSPKIAANEEGVLLGVNEHAGQATPVRIRYEDRVGHQIIVGKTRMGKSTLMHQMIRQDINNGFGVAVIDPHANLVRDILRCSIPPEREADVVVWDLANPDNPPPLNLLAVPEGYDRRDASKHIMDFYNEVEAGFADSEMADTMNMALLTLMAEDQPTIRDTTRVYTDADYRWELTRQLSNRTLTEYWQEWDSFGTGRQTELARPVRRRLRRFYEKLALEFITCHPKGFDIASYIRERRIVLISLHPRPEDQLTESDIDPLGSIMVSLFQMAIMTGAATQANPFYLYVDEAQRFVSTAIDKVFSEAGKRHLSLTLGHQFLDQLDAKTLKAVMGNVGAMLIMELGNEADLRKVGPYVEPQFKRSDLMKQGAYHATLVMRFHGEQQPAFNIQTQNIPELEDTTRLPELLETEARIRALSIQRYTPDTRQDIIDWLESKYAQPKPAQVEPTEAIPEDISTGEDEDENSADVDDRWSEPLD